MEESEMKRIIVIFTMLLLSASTQAQTGTTHGVSVKWTAATQGADPNTIAGYNIYQCQGTCTASTGVWVKIDTSLDVSTAYLVPLSGLTAGGTYSFVATAVDSGGNESAFSNVATVTLPAVLPVNPNAPANTTATVQ
jgi:hypothetical protein